MDHFVRPSDNPSVSPLSLGFLHAWASLWLLYSLNILIDILSHLQQLDVLSLFSLCCRVFKFVTFYITHIYTYIIIHMLLFFKFKSALCLDKAIYCRVITRKNELDKNIYICLFLKTMVKRGGEKINVSNFHLVILHMKGTCFFLQKP